MNFLKPSCLKQLYNFCLCLLLGLGCCSSVVLARLVFEPTSATAQASTGRLLNSRSLVPDQHLNLAIIFRYFRRSPKRSDGAPTDTGSAGRRGPCHELNQSFAALVPRIEVNSPNSLAGITYGFTTQVHPTAFVYLPDLSEFLPPTESGDFSAQFMLQQLQGQDEVDLLDSAINISIPPRAGIVAINFEDLNLTLDPDQAYHWYLSVICDQERPSRNPSVDAWLEVVDAGERQVIEDKVSAITNDLEKVEFYVEQEIWHDAVTLLVALRCQAPSNVQYKEELKELLTTLFLDDQIEARIKNKIAEAVETQQCPAQLRVASN